MLAKKGEKKCHQALLNAKQLRVLQVKASLDFALLVNQETPNSS